MSSSTTTSRGGQGDVRDRIHDVWGPRTPHARGTEWPVRVDLHLDDGLTEGDVDHWVRSACVLCSNGCGCEIAVKGGRMVGIRGVPTDAVNHGRLRGLIGKPGCGILQMNGQPTSQNTRETGADCSPGRSARRAGPATTRG